MTVFAHFNILSLCIVLMGQVPLMDAGANVKNKIELKNKNILLKNGVAQKDIQLLHQLQEVDLAITGNKQLLKNVNRRLGKLNKHFVSAKNSYHSARTASLQIETDISTLPQAIQNEVLQKSQADTLFIELEQNFLHLKKQQHANQDLAKELKRAIARLESQQVLVLEWLNVERSRTDPSSKRHPQAHHRHAKSKSYYGLKSAVGARYIKRSRRGIDDFNRGKLPWPVKSKPDREHGLCDFEFEEIPSESNFGTIDCPGLRFQIKKISTVRSIANGIIQYAGQAGSTLRNASKDLLKNVVIIEHAGGYLTVYTGLVTHAHQVGDHISKGDILGIVRKGSLYFEIRYKTQVLDPTLWLKPFEHASTTIARQ